MYVKCNTKMSKLTVIHTIRFSEKQAESLQKLKDYDVNVSRFIRIAISEKKPEPRKDISLKLENFSNSEITGFMGYSGEFYIKLTDIIDCDNVKLKCKVTHWRYFL